jgi:RNA polymerase sigma factor (sigma-70 family)
MKDARQPCPTLTDGVSPSKRSRYEEFVAANGDGLVRLAYAICGDRGRAEDAGQEALIRVYQRWSRLTDPLACARRTAINATRADSRRSVRADRAYRDAPRLPSTDADDPQERVVTNRALMDALDELPHGQREVIVLRYGCQLSEGRVRPAKALDRPNPPTASARGSPRWKPTAVPHCGLVAVNVPE